MRKHYWKLPIVSVAGIAAVVDSGSLASLPKAESTRQTENRSVVSNIPASRFAASQLQKQLRPQIANRHRQKLIEPVRREQGFTTQPVGLASASLSLPYSNRGGIEKTHRDPATNTSLNTDRRQALAPQFNMPAQVPGSRPENMAPMQLAKSNMLHAPNAAYVSQISPTEARAYFDRVGLGDSEIDEDVVEQFDFSQVEHFGRMPYLEVVEEEQASEKAPAKLIVRPMKLPSEQTVPEDIPVISQRPDNNNHKSPVAPEPQQMGMTESK
ncbi:MAG: hypothetical protein ACRCY3_00020 [Sphingorhabdus sp.]